MTSPANTPSGRRNGSPETTAAFASCFALTFTACLVSILFPGSFSQFVDSLCSQLRYVCIPGGFYLDEEVLSPLGYPEYGAGFVGLRRVSAIILVLQAAVLILGSASQQRRAVSSAKRSTSMPIILMFFAAVAWWILVSRDFYFAGDGSMRLVLHTPSGTIIYGFGLIFLSMAVAWPFALAIGRSAAKRKQTNVYGRSDGRDR